MAEKKKGGEDRQHKPRKDAITGIAGTGGSSGAGGVSAPLDGMGSVSGIDPNLDENGAPMPGSVGKGKAGSRDMQESDGGLPGRTRGPSGETVPNQSGGNKGQQGQRDGHQSDGSQQG